MPLGKSRSDNRFPTLAGPSRYERAAYLLVIRQRIDRRLQVIWMLDEFQKVRTQSTIRIARLSQLPWPFGAIEAVEEQEHLEKN